MKKRPRYRIKVDKQPYSEEVYIPQKRGTFSWGNLYEYDKELGEYKVVSFPSEPQARQFIETYIKKINSVSRLHITRYIYL